MRTLVHWDPFAGVTGMRRFIDRVFDDSHFRPYRYSANRWHNGYLPVDVTEGENEVVIKASLPGLKPEDVDISLDANVLTIKGEAATSEDSESGRYVIRERRWGAFNRSLSLPESLEGEKADATFEDGILTLTIPKAEEAKPKAIKVKGVKKLEGNKD